MPNPPPHDVEIASWHALESAEVLRALASDAHGLTGAEAESRLKLYGSNAVPVTRGTSVLQRVRRQFRDPLIYVLLAAGCVTAAMQHWTDTGVIAAVIVLNALVGFIQEQKAENALSAIRQLLSLNANVLRDGATHMIAAEQLVPGDIVMLTGGDKVPADVRLLSANSLRMQEAILTGESLDVEKSMLPVAAHASLGDRYCMAYSGTLVTAGQGKGVVVATAENTQIGQIGAMIGQVASPETPLTRKLARFSRVLAVWIVVLSAAIFCFGVTVRGLTASEMFMVMIAIAVSAIPEGLPAVISIILALGMRAMARRNAIVRHLPVVEALGGATVICTDKTGTLTKNELMVTDIIIREHAFDVTGVGYAPEGKILFEQQQISIEEHPALSVMGHAAILNNDATLCMTKGVWELNGDPTEGALLSFAHKAGYEAKATQAAWPRADVIPFSAEARMMATLHHGAGGSIIYVKGAPEEILAMCDHQRNGVADEPLDAAYWQEQVAVLARQGKRVLAVASGAASAQQQKLQPDALRGTLSMLGLFGIIDAPREQAKSAIAACLHAGIAVKMITGDHALTASAMGALLGIPSPTQVMTGMDMERLSDAALAQAVASIHIYARMHPEHKLKLVRALQVNGEVVAMTGDGVNDAPAIRMADIGIAMGRNGTEVAKEASDLVLTDDNFASIVHAIEEGRNNYTNIKRTIQFMLVTDGCEALTLILATLMGFALPITPLQILWVNMVTSVTLSLSFAFAPYDPDVMRQRPIRLSAPIFSRAAVGLFLVHALIISAGTIGLFLHEMQTGDLSTARTVAIHTLVWFQIYYLWGMLCVQKKSSKGIKPYAPLIISTITIIALQLLLSYLPWMQRLFGTTPLDAAAWLKINAVAVTIAIWIIVEYRMISRRRRTCNAWR
jgi:calcium-translocating P-type ATPase